jgi:transposase
MTRDEIKTIYDAGPEMVVTLVLSLVEQIEQLTERVAELEARLATNSRNSSQPPSSDGPAKPLKPTRQASGRKPGGQKGHPGTTLKPSPQPDHIERHAPEACAHCQHSLAAVAGGEAPEARQVFDLPPLKLAVTEHRLVNKICPHCAWVNDAQFPAAIPPGVSYGPNLKALAVYLVSYHLLPWQRTCELIGDLTGQPIAEGTLATALKQCAGRLAAPEAEIKQAIGQAPVGHFDETGVSLAGKGHWLHVASTPSLTHYALHPKRGSQATDEIGILPDFQGRAIHDGWPAYFTYACAHGLCNAHHLRELTFVDEQLKQAWAGQMIKLLLAIKQQVAQAVAAHCQQLPADKQAEFEQAYDRLLAAGLALPENQPPPPSGKRGRQKQSKAKNLLDRLSKRKRETLAFMYDFRVPFDNNLAERDLRMIKVQQKVSGCFRSSQGAKAFCRIRGYISSVKKQGRHVLSALRSVFTGQPLSLVIQG